MTLRKRIKSRFKLTLRRFGMLCKRPQSSSKRIRITKTLWPDGTVTKHDRITEQPLNESNTFETELHIWKEIHKDTFSKKKPRTNK